MKSQNSNNSITVSWYEPITKHGPKKFVGKLEDGNSAQAGAKDISYLDPSGNIQYADPYKPGKIEIMRGSYIILRMVTGKTGHNALGWGVTGDRQSEGIKKAKNNKLITMQFKPKTSQVLTECRDSYDPEFNVLEWCVHSFNDDGTIPKTQQKEDEQMFSEDIIEVLRQLLK